MQPICRDEATAGPPLGHRHLGGTGREVSSREGKGAAGKGREGAAQAGRNILLGQTLISC